MRPAAKLAVPGFAVLGLVMSLWPVLSSGFRLMPTDPGDSRLNNYLLEHGYRWIQGAAELWSPAIFHPVRGTFAYGDVLLGAAPIYWALRATGFEPDTAFQLWIGACLALDYGIMWLWLARGLGMGAGASAAGAFLFAFGSTRIAQLNHQQLLPQFFTVLALHASTRLLQEGQGKIGPAGQVPPWGWIAVFFACLVLQLHASFYLGWFALLGMGIALAWALALRRLRDPLLAAVRGHGKAISAAAALSALALAPMVTRYLQVGRELGFRRFADVQPMLPLAYSWLYLGPESWLYSWQGSVWPWRILVPNSFRHEHAIGLGLVTLGLATWGLLRERRGRPAAPIAQLSLLCVGTIVVCVTLVAPGVTLWSLFFPIIPGASAIRAISRVALLLLIPLSLGLGLAFDALHGRPWLFAIALSLVIAEQGRRIAFYDKQETRELVGAISEQVRTRRCAVFYYSPVLPQTGVPVRERPMRWDPVPWAHPIPYKYQVDAIWAQWQTGVPTLNGYAGKQPREWMQTIGWNQIASSDDLPRIRDGLRRWAAIHSIDFDLDRCWIKLVDLERGSP